VLESASAHGWAAANARRLAITKTTRSAAAILPASKFVAAGVDFV
jgi:hypothetical protein